MSAVVTIEVFVEGCEPKKAHPSDACWDLFAAEECIIPPGGRAAICNGFRMAIPLGYEAQIRPRSGNALKKGITVLNTPGTIDANYRGNIGTILFNSSMQTITIQKGDKIAQMAICKLPEVELEFGKVDTNTDRGTSGFGSTGVVSGAVEDSNSGV